jgi:hypothetical protein
MPVLAYCLASTPTPTPTPTETPEETPTETPEETPTETPEETPTEEWYLNGAGPYEFGTVVLVSAAGLFEGSPPCTGPGDTYVWTCDADLTDNGDTADVTSYASGNYTVDVACDYGGT